MKFTRLYSAGKEIQRTSVRLVIIGKVWNDCAAGAMDLSGRAIQNLKSKFIKSTANVDRVIISVERPNTGRQGGHLVSNPIRVVKIGEDGTITFSMSEMAGQYLLVEEREGEIVLSPYDLRWQAPGSSIAKLGKRLLFVQTAGDIPPAA